MGYRPWAPDFAPDNVGDDPFPRPFLWGADADVQPLQWQIQDWDPALRFWTLPWDPTLTEWLRDQDSTRAAIMAAREFAGQWQLWQMLEGDLVANGWLDAYDLGWKNGVAGPPAISAQAYVQSELAELFLLMENDRDRYLDESHVQADGLAGYIIKKLGIDGERKPWTIELIACGLSIGNIVYMHYKELFRRARPSTLAPGLVPPFGPPRHPAFPSGHSFLGHLIALLLMEIPQVAERFGEDPPTPADDSLPAARPMDVRPRIGRQATLFEVRSDYVFTGPLLWLAQRLARNRERMGVHYRSDSRASRWLAGSIWAALTYREGAIECPTLERIIRQAAVEWV